MGTIIIGKLCMEEEVFPVGLFIVAEDSNKSFQFLVHPFCLAICLGVVGRENLGVAPRALRKSRIRSESNCRPRSEMIWSGTPWNLNTRCIYNLAVVDEVTLSMVGMK